MWNNWVTSISPQGYQKTEQLLTRKAKPSEVTAEMAAHIEGWPYTPKDWQYSAGLTLVYFAHAVRRKDYNFIDLLEPRMNSTAVSDILNKKGLPEAATILEETGAAHFYQPEFIQTALHYFIIGGPHLARAAIKLFLNDNYITGPDEMRDAMKEFYRPDGSRLEFFKFAVECGMTDEKWVDTQIWEDEGDFVPEDWNMSEFSMANWVKAYARNDPAYQRVLREASATQQVGQNDRSRPRERSSAEPDDRSAKRPALGSTQRNMSTQTSLTSAQIDFLMRMGNAGML